MTEVAFHGAYIELQHLLKKLDLVQTGGEVKFFLAEKEIIVNGDYESRRGRKLYAGDIVQIADVGEYLLATENPVDAP